MEEKERFKAKAYEVGTEMLEYAEILLPALLMFGFMWIIGKL